MINTNDSYYYIHNEDCLQDFLEKLEKGFDETGIIHNLPFVINVCGHSLFTYTEKRCIQKEVNIIYDWRKEVSYKNVLRTAKGIDNCLVLDSKYKYVLEDNVLRFYE